MNAEETSTDRDHGFGADWWDEEHPIPMNTLLSEDDVAAIVGRRSDRSPGPRALRLDRSPSVVERFIGRASGTCWQHVLSESSARRQVTLGWIVVMTSVVTFTTSQFTLQILGLSARDAWSASGIISLVTFFIDRFLVAAPPDGLGYRCMRAVPRLVFAVGLGLVCSTAVMSSIFQNDIERIVLERRVEATQQTSEVVTSVAQAAQKEVDEIEAEIDQLEAEERAAIARRDEQAALVEAEMSGSGGTGMIGAGTEHQRLVGELTRTDEVVRNIQSVRASLETTLAARKTALNEVETRAVDEQSRIESAALAKPLTLADRLDSVSFIHGPNATAIRWVLLASLFAASAFPAVCALRRPSSHDLLIAETERMSREAIVRQESFALKIRQDLLEIELYAQRTALLDQISHPLRHGPDRADIGSDVRGFSPPFRPA